MKTDLSSPVATAKFFKFAGIFSAVLIIREMQIKTIGRYYLTQVRWPSSESLQTINSGEYVE